VWGQRFVEFLGRPQNLDRTVRIPQKSRTKETSDDGTHSGGSRRPLLNGTDVQVPHAPHLSPGVQGVKHHRFKRHRGLASGIGTVRGRQKREAAGSTPISPDQNPTMSPVYPSITNPVGMAPRWQFPPPPYPLIMMAVPPVISRNPNMSRAWGPPVFLDDDVRRANSNHEFLRCCGCPIEGKKTFNNHT
jgi:hypothetical protein